VGESGGRGEWGKGRVGKVEIRNYERAIITFPHSGTLKSTREHSRALPYC